VSSAEVKSGAAVQAGPERICLAKPQRRRVQISIKGDNRPDAVAHNRSGTERRLDCALLPSRVWKPVNKLSALDTSHRQRGSVVRAGVEEQLTACPFIRVEGSLQLRPNGFSSSAVPLHTNNLPPVYFQFATVAWPCSALNPVAKRVQSCG
jgi:hypothetical protein